MLVIFVRGQDGAGSPGANSWELESGPSAEVMLVAESGSTLAVSHLQSPSRAPYLQDLTKATWQKSLNCCSDLQRPSFCITDESLERKANQG